MIGSPGSRYSKSANAVTCPEQEVFRLRAGCTRSLIAAGARSALATLWFINDEASAELVSEFYRQLRNPKLSKAQALQYAQQKLLEDRVYEHPAYWSPFLLLNNWL